MSDGFDRETRRVSLPPAVSLLVERKARLIRELEREVTRLKRRNGSLLAQLQKFKKESGTSCPRAPK